jgi:ABC-2 type transport system permease protein
MLRYMLIVLGFAGLWAVPVLASLAGGDLFSAEDRYGTWAAILTRSRSRAELFAGKTLAASSFSLAAVIVLAASSVAAGTLVIGLRLPPWSSSTTSGWACRR